MPEDNPAGKPGSKPEPVPPQKAPRTASARKRTPKAAQAKPEPVVAPATPAVKPAAGPERESRSKAKAPRKAAAEPAAKRAPRDRKADAAQPTVAEPLIAPAAPAPAPGGLSVLMVTPEAHPFAKTGGLAEVTAALSDALGRLGHAVTLVLPRYRSIDIGGLDRLQTRIGLGGRVQPVAFVERKISDRVTAVFVDVPELFDRESLYGNPDGDYADNAWRFAVFCRAALEYARLKEWRPSIIHAHDWQAGLVPVYQKMLFSSDPYVGGVPVVFTLHNLAFQGVFPPSTLGPIGLGPEVYDVQAMEYWGNISYLKGGINFSEKVTTVSPGYAREIVRPELGFGLDGVLARRADDLVGILNGIDTERWTPTADQFVAARFSADDLTGKQDAKRLLLGCRRPARGRERHGAAARRPHLAFDRSERVRLDRRRG